jgi:hypothetical protein
MKNHLIKIHNHADVSNLPLLNLDREHLQNENLGTIQIETLLQQPVNDVQSQV